MAITSLFHRWWVASACIKVELAAYRTIFAPEVVFMETGAGGWGFTIVPLGAMTSMGRKMPWFFGRS